LHGLNYTLEINLFVIRRNQTLKIP